MDEKQIDLPLISIIIPIYNVEHYLVDCLNSVVNQTYTNLEIILVNDGSPDNCGAICDQYAMNDQRIRVIHKENGGLSDARNAGLDISNGDYISFIDSDDVINNRFIEILYKQLIDFEADVAICKVYQFNEKLIVPNLQFDLSPVEIWDRNTFRNNIFNFKYYPEIVTAWSKLYKKDYFFTLRFEKGRIYEDTIILHHIVELTKKCVYLKLPLYYYRSNPESITQSNSGIEKKFEHAIYALNQRIKFYSRLGMNQFVKKTEDQIALHKIDKFLNNQCDLDFKEKVKLIKFIFRDNFSFKTKLVYILKIFKLKF